MGNLKTTQESLNTILQKGDLYDVIALKKGAKPQNHWFLKANVFFVSRILYVGVLIYEKIKASFAPVEQVKDAQNQIRSILKVDVDIVKSKNRRFYKIVQPLKHLAGKLFDTPENTASEKTQPFLSILYEDDNIEMEDYLKNLEKILTFCELHDIGEVLLRTSDITDSVVDINLGEFREKAMPKVLGKPGSDYIYTYPDYDLLSLTPSGLKRLIKKLEVATIDKDFISSLAAAIEDRVVKKAVNQFLLNGDLESLKKVVNQRLTLNINGDSSYRDKEHGKIFEDVVIVGEHIKVTTKTSAGKIVGNAVCTLCDFLCVNNLGDLINQMEKPNDNMELLLLSALYLYLCDNTKINHKHNEKKLSFYDQIYTAFKETKKRKPIPGLYTKDERVFKNIGSKVISALLLCMMLTISLITGIAMDVVRDIAYKKDGFAVTQNIYEGIVAPYRYSWNLEKKLIGKIGATLSDFGQRSIERIRSITETTTGDSANKSTEIIGRIQQLNDDVALPTYFAEGYAFNSTYNKGQIHFDLKQRANSFLDIENLRTPLFKVIQPINKSSFKADMTPNLSDYKDSKTLRPTLHPVGDDYVLTDVSIIDRADESSVVIYSSALTDSALELIESMEKPEIHYTYGICNVCQNTFVNNLERPDSYSVLSFEELRSIIIKGLNLDETATIEEIFIAIQSKKYSETPIKDAGLTRRVAKMTEAEYLECVASLDSLVCNLAATLAVNIDNELVYTVGYLNDGDEYIKENEAHAWAMYPNGEIVDITPVSNSENEAELDNKKDALRDFIIYCLEHNVPVYALITLGGGVFFILFKKTIKPVIKRRAVRSMLSSPSINVTYAKIKEVLYGGINNPIKRTPIELIDMINGELNALEADELKELKIKLLSDNSGIDKEVLREAAILIDDILYIRENAEDLKLKLW